jgi:hypothetical protein
MRWADTSSLLVVVSQNWSLLDTNNKAHNRWRRHLKNSKAGKAALETNQKAVDAAYHEMMAHRRR